MKSSAALFGTALLATVLPGPTGLLEAQYNLTPTPAMPATPPPPAPSPPSGAKIEGKAEPDGTIVGLELARKDGRWLGLAIEDGNFKLRFYDQHKKPEKPDVARAAAHWDPVGKVGELHTVLNPEGDGLVLRAPQFVSPPFTFKVFLTLLSADDQVVETFVVDEQAP
jgi:hypothetical protein